MNRSLKITFVLLVLAIFIAVHFVKAEDEHEHESDHEYENEHEDWDMSEDFVPQTVQTVQETKIVYVYPNVTDPNATSNIGSNHTNVTIPELNLSAYEDSDGDGVMNMYDLYPGEDDKLYMDSDNDTIVDRYDKYPGANDLDFEDIDGDGVIDSHDSNIGKMTDKDHDGIDDAYDTHDDRSWFVKVLSTLGLMN